MNQSVDTQRHIRLFGATCIGVGAIAGVTALSFAELSTAFPHSGGPYVFAKRVLSVGTAFLIGWIVWFASTMAAVLYAVGLAALATAACTLVVAGSPAGGGNAVSVPKVLVFAVLVAGGAWAWKGAGAGELGSFVPLLPHGPGGLLRAMGYTFIAMQGFDLIAAVAGEVKEPRRTVPRAMLLAFALAHVLCIVVRWRKPHHAGFRVPWWPWLPAIGALACTGLAVFQGVTVPSAGLLELRGRSPLVLVPIASGANAGVLGLFGACLSPPRVGRVLLLNIVPPLHPQVPEEFYQGLLHSSTVLRDSLGAAARAGARTEALPTLAHDPWAEIERVAREHRCTTLLIGMSELSDAALRGRLEWLASSLTCDLVVVRIPSGWRPEKTRRVLVPIRGGAYGSLRARLLASLRHRAAPEMEVVYLLVLPPTTTAAQRARNERADVDLLRTEASTASIVRSVLSDEMRAAIASEAETCDLLLLGLSRPTSTEGVFSPMIRKIVATTDCAALVISERR